MRSLRLLLPAVLALCQPALAQTEVRNLAVAAAADAPAPSHPPPTIADLVLLLQSYKPDTARVARLHAEVDAPVPADLPPGAAARAWHAKAIAAEDLQDYVRRGQFLERAMEHSRAAGRLPPPQLGGLLRLRSDLADNLLRERGAAAGLDSYIALANDVERTPFLGFVIRSHVQLVKLYLHVGDVEQARQSLARAEAAFKTQSRNPKASANFTNWSRMIEVARGGVLRSEGRLEDEERTYRAALRLAEDSVEQVEAREQAGRFVVESRMEDSRDNTAVLLAQTLTLQGRYDDAELMLREVLKRALVREGRNSALVGRSLAVLNRIYQNRGRFAEAVVIGEWAEKALAEAGVSDRSPVRINARIGLAHALGSAGRHAESVALIDKLRAALKEDARLEEGFAHGTLGSIRSFIAVGRIDDALRDGDRLLEHNVRHFGADHYTTAESRGFRAMALHRRGRTVEARAEFARAVEVLTDPAKEIGRQKASVSNANRLRHVINEYLTVLMGRKGTAEAKDAAEAFRVSDVARWQTVQKALAGSALRAAAGTPELAARIKKVQDADDELEATYKNLISQRSAPPERQLPVVISAMESRIAALKKEQAQDLAEIRRQFPQYDALVNPRPVDVPTARKALQASEVLLSIYVTPGGSYVWAVPKSGELRFHFTAQSPAWIAERVARMRASVDLSRSGLAKLDFDVNAGVELYRELLAPVAPAWQGARTLLVVANGALGQLPFSMLPTAAATAADAGLPLSRYRAVPWLARDVAVAYLPSVSALATLRALPPPSGGRQPFVGFGDPDFGGAAPAAGGTRKAGSGLRNLAIARPADWDERLSGTDAVPAAPSPPAVQIPPLPDTREEILAIGRALGANLQSDAIFGPRANPQTVQATPLKDRRVVAFATHGLVAGDLPGLDQPALAMAYPAGGAVESGLLRLDQILRLSLNADLVVLSACNTAAADGNGAEAVSGLGRGFFYAGARSVLATHWPVETVSARELVSTLFRGYASDPKLTRAQALQKAMLDMIDRGQAVDAQGKAGYAYAHPAFWAPYALYGDPGR